VDFSLIVWNIPQIFEIKENSYSLGGFKKSIFWSKNSVDRIIPEMLHLA